MAEPLVSDAVWTLVAPLLPSRPKGGRPPLDDRKVLERIVFVHRTGMPWGKSMLHHRWGHGSSTSPFMSEAIMLAMVMRRPVGLRLPTFGKLALAVVMAVSATHIAQASLLFTYTELSSTHLRVAGTLEFADDAFAHGQVVGDWFYEPALDTTGNADKLLSIALRLDGVLRTFDAPDCAPHFSGPCASFNFSLGSGGETITGDFRLTPGAGLEQWIGQSVGEDWVVGHGSDDFASPCFGSSMLANAACLSAGRFTVISIDEPGPLAFVIAGLLGVRLGFLIRTRRASAAKLPPRTSTSC